MNRRRRWSRLAPSPFLVRLLATAHTTDLFAAAEQATRASIATKPELAANLDSTLNAYRVWLKQLQPALAIAWTRCRRAGSTTLAARNTPA